jgi:hypothetical protein
MTSIPGEIFPGGEHVVAATPTALEAGNTKSCSSITLRADTGSSRVFWGYDDMTTGTKRRGFIEDGESVVIPSPVNPESLFLFGTAGDVVFWVGIPA